MDTLLEEIEGARTLDDLNDRVRGLREHLGVQHAVYHSVGSGGEQYAALTYPASWVQTYIANDYQKVDPVVLACRTSYGPILWSDLDWSSRGARSLLAEAQAHGVGTQGYSVPIHGPAGKFALFTVTSDMEAEAWSVFVRANAERLVVAAHYLNRSARRIDGTHEETCALLSPRETDALSMLALGHSRGQAAAALSISEHTLRAYIEGARHKLGAANTVQAVARATARGMLLH